MRTQFLSVIALLALLLASCQKDEEQQRGTVKFENGSSNVRVGWLYLGCLALDENLLDDSQWIYPGGHIYVDALPGGTCYKVEGDIQPYDGSPDITWDGECIIEAGQTTVIRLTNPEGSLSIGSIWWSDDIDNDADGYSQYRKLNIDVNISSGSASVFVKVYYKPYSSGSYSLYYTTSNFSVVGLSGTDAQPISIGSPNTQLSHNFYDFKVELYKAGGSAPIVIQGPAEDIDLDDAWFETGTQDGGTSATYTIYDAWWDDQVDTDGDGYTRYRKLYFDPDVNSGTHSVYVKVYRRTGTVIYSSYYTTTSFSITGSNSDAFWVAIGLPNTELSHSVYDFLIELYETGSSSIKATREANDDSDLNDQFFETSAQD